MTCGILLFLFYVLPISIQAQTSSIPLPNPGFELNDGKGFPSQWKIEKLPMSGGISVQMDNIIRRGGTGSIKILHSQPNSSTVSSSTVTLQVGKLYRLSGWIKTENAFSDPTKRYPTPVAATLTMSSFPFTMNSPAVGATKDWRYIEVLFIATQKQDQVQLHLGYNGTAAGTAWFDDIDLEEEQDITKFIPMETVRWFGPAFRYTDKGWTFIHIEGEPYQRGYQYGFLLAKEISAYIEKVGTRYLPDNPRQAWNERRTLTDALFLRKYDEEYLLEMRGIADGAVKAGASFGGRGVDFLDIVTLNSVVDLGQLGDALTKTAQPLSGRSFRKEEEELNVTERLHKCSSFLANGPATKDGRVVFAQLFMWNGYTGFHWDVICDVVPSKGHRLVYETFPGGIHSGSDFYINDTGIMIGETTVAQTPFDADGTPQSNRIRKAAQYGSSIDDVVKILVDKNNGLYTNDWLIADTKTDETAILLLGTKKYKLWRSRSGEFPGDTKGFYWSVNNAKDPEVRKEYIPDPANAPLDFIYNNVNRDLAFYEYYQREKGKIDGISAVNIIASSPINRPHACDGKVTTSEMAEKMVLLAHYGKVTLREKFPEKNNRLLMDWPNASPHLTLGYSAFSPVYISDAMKAAHAKEQKQPVPEKSENDFTEIRSSYGFDKTQLWINTVLPAAEADNWFVSASAAYWNILNGLPSDNTAAVFSTRDQLTEMNCRLQYTIDREGTMVPQKSQRTYDGYKNYLIPRIKGTYALHQLRLLLGNDVFAKVMNAVHTSFKEKPMSTAQFIAKAEEVSKLELRSFIMQWLQRDDLPQLQWQSSVTQVPDGWKTAIEIRQPGEYYSLVTSAALETDTKVEWKPLTIQNAVERFEFVTKNKPRKIVLNAMNDFPSARKNFYTLSNFFDDYQNSIIVCGTTREIEANHTLALRYQTVLADQFTEILPPVIQDAEVTVNDRSTLDLIVIGNTADNSLLRELAVQTGLVTGKNNFRWKGKLYSEPEDGLFVVYPNPVNPKKVVYLAIANSALELYHMTKRYQGLPSWGIFKGDQIIERGYHSDEEFEKMIGQ
jgi:hypothetical protein